LIDKAQTWLSSLWALTLNFGLWVLLLRLISYFKLVFMPYYVLFSIKRATQSLECCVKVRHNSMLYTLTSGIT
jgi:hypothetical protein